MAFSINTLDFAPTFYFPVSYILFQGSACLVFGL